MSWPKGLGLICWLVTRGGYCPCRYVIPHASLLGFIKGHCCGLGLLSVLSLSHSGRRKATRSGIRLFSLSGTLLFFFSAQVARYLSSRCPRLVGAPRSLSRSLFCPSYSLLWPSLSLRLSRRLSSRAARARRPPSRRRAGSCSPSDVSAERSKGKIRMGTCSAEKSVSVTTPTCKSELYNAHRCPRLIPVKLLHCCRNGRRFHYGCQPW